MSQHLYSLPLERNKQNLQDLHGFMCMFKIKCWSEIWILSMKSKTVISSISGTGELSAREWRDKKFYSSSLQSTGIITVFLILLLFQYLIINIFTILNDIILLGLFQPAADDAIERDGVPNKIKNTYRFSLGWVFIEQSSVASQAEKATSMHAITVTGSINHEPNCYSNSSWWTFRMEWMKKG